MSCIHSGMGIEYRSERRDKETETGMRTPCVTSIIRTCLMWLIACGLLGCGGGDRHARDHDDFPYMLQKPDLETGKPLPEDMEPAEKLPEITAAEYERLGDLRFVEKNYQMAFVHYEKALRSEPDNVRVRYKQALTFLAVGIYDSAVSAFQRLVEEEPHHARAHEGLGQAYFHQKKFNQAQAGFAEAVRLDPSLWRSHNFLGVIYDYEKKYGEAVAEYQKALAIKPDDALAYNNLGMSYFLNGEYEKSVAAFGKSLQIGPAEQRTYNNLGLALARLGRFDRAFEALRKGGGDAQAYNNVGVLYLSEGEPQKARESFTTAIELKPLFYEKANENLEKCRMAHLYEPALEESNEGGSEQ